MLSNAPSPKLVVLDTQVVLDAWVFGNADAAFLVDALESGHWQWLASPGMRLELARVLQRPMLSTWQPDEVTVLGQFDRLARLLAHEPPSAKPRLTCSDPDDQVFIDLAVQERASALFTRDKALLRLTKRAAAFGVAILRPDQASAFDQKEKREAQPSLP